MGFAMSTYVFLEAVRHSQTVALGQDVPAMTLSILVGAAAAALVFTASQIPNVTGWRL